MTSVFVLFSYVPRNDKDVDEYNDNINAAVDDGWLSMDEAAMGGPKKDAGYRETERESEWLESETVCWAAWMKHLE